MRLLIALLLLPLLGGAAWDEEANARCEISQRDFVWSEPCFIQRTGRHNLTLGWLAEHRFPFGWSGIFITSADGRTGRLRVHISFGGNRYLGHVRRSTRDPDCWLMEGLKICAREGR